jgi:hypothetical protein
MRGTLLNMNSKSFLKHAHKKQEYTNKNEESQSEHRNQHDQAEEHDTNSLISIHVQATTSNQEENKFIIMGFAWHPL